MRAIIAVPVFLVLMSSVSAHAAGIDGGFVILGMHTSRMTKQELGDLIDIIYAFGAERGVKWTQVGP